MIDILIAPYVAGLQLRRSVLEQLFEKHPELFGEPLPLSEFAVPGLTPPAHEDDEELFANSVVKGELVYFLTLDQEARTCPWLLEKFRAEGSSALTPRNTKRELKIVSIPDDVKWYVFSDSDGSESVREHARIWQ